MATDKNTLKNWFKTAAKPTQEQFWAWMDSFYHKDERISQDKINGLSKTLEAKADEEQLSAKANKDATELTEDDKQSWKTALGVGELPTNIATIDQGEQQGNVYDKEQINELLENSGKNIANTDLRLPQGTVRTLDITDAKLQLKGLQNKTSDKSYNLRIRANANGDLAISTEADINLVMPMEANLTINHIFPSTPPQPQPWAEEIKEIMRNYSTYVFTPFTKEDFVGNEDFVSNDGNFIHKPTSYWGEPFNSSKKMPNDRDWIIKIEALNMPGFFGLSQTAGKHIDVGFQTLYGFATDQGGFSVWKGNRRLGGHNQFNGVGLIIKKGNLFISIGYSNNETDVKILNGNLDFGEYMLAINRFGGRAGYKIF